MSTVSKKELIKAVNELNEKIAEPPIKKKDEKKMAKKVLIAAKLIEKSDGISKSTMNTIKALKGAKKSSSSSEKLEKKKDKKKSDKKKTKKASGELSNKAKIYLARKKDKKISPEKLEKLVNKQVKLSTIKGWLRDWKNGNNLPGVANS